MDGQVETKPGQTVQVSYLFITKDVVLIFIYLLLSLISYYKFIYINKMQWYLFKNILTLYSQ